MLANRTPDGLRIYAMAAQDDAVGGAPAAVAMANAVKAPDSVTPDTPETGGHAGPLWREHIPTMLAWWGSDNSVARAVGTPPTAEAAQSSSGFGQIVTAQTVTHRTRAFGLNGAGSLVVVGLLALLSALLCALRVPRWVAADGSGNPPPSAESAGPDGAGAGTADRATDRAPTAESEEATARTRAGTTTAGTDGQPASTGTEPPPGEARRTPGRPRAWAVHWRRCAAVWRERAHALPACRGGCAARGSSPRAWSLCPRPWAWSPC